MNNKDKFMVGLTCFLGGVVVGFLISPMKKGITIGSHNKINDVNSDELNDTSKKSTLEEVKDEKDNVEE